MTTKRLINGLFLTDIAARALKLETRYKNQVY